MAHLLGWLTAPWLQCPQCLARREGESISLVDDKSVQYSEVCPISETIGQAGLFAGRGIARIPLIFNILGHRQTGQAKTYPDIIYSAT